MDFHDEIRQYRRPMFVGPCALVVSLWRLLISRGAFRLCMRFAATNRATRRKEDKINEGKCLAKIAETAPSLDYMEPMGEKI